MLFPRLIRLSVLIAALTTVIACDDRSGSLEVLAQIEPNLNASVDALEVNVTRAANGDYIIDWQADREDATAMLFANTQLTHKLSDSEVVAESQSPPITWTPTDGSSHYYFSLLYRGRLVIVDGATGELVEPDYDVLD
ncbi:MAG: hypothetical protein AAFV47_11020 [Pseudomonadota bacterium]